MTNKELTTASIFEKFNVSGKTFNVGDVFRKINENSVPLSEEEFSYLFTNTK